MSRPVSSGESLEAILASIRRSLAEQATDTLEEEPAAAPDAPEAPPDDFRWPPAPESPARPFVAPAAETPGSSAAGAGGPEPPATPAETPSPAPARTAPPPDPAPAPAAAAPVPAPEPVPTREPAPASAPTPEPPRTPEPAPAPEAAPEAAYAGQKDPLWFLGQEAAQKAATPTAAAPAAEPKPAAPDDSGRRMPPASASLPPRAPEARPSREPSRASSLRAPLPPFFGSSAGTVQVEIAPDPPVLPGNGAVNGAVPPGSVPPAPAPAPAPRLNGAAHNGGGPPGPQPTPRPADAQLNGTASAIFAQRAAADAKTAAAEALPQMPGLEAMVAELLRPMLRQWLDENMPRLVSAALEAELRSRQEPGKP